MWERENAMAISCSHERMHVKIDYWCSSSNVMHDVHVVLALSTRPFISASDCVRACISGVFLGHHQDGGRD